MSPEGRGGAVESIASQRCIWSSGMLQCTRGGKNTRKSNVIFVFFVLFNI